ncbi:MAG TPA: adenylate/guanylate cyclase domain-containing protein [Burkholderiales bacterium]|nr:adenylate/guanylate cyclase domain-containing protein [Burkholderiales bacterium]
MKAERKPAAILYAELRNFTRMSEMLEPGRVLALANEFFNLVARAADMCGGKVLWVQNDTLVLAFASSNAPQFTQQAFQAAQVVQREFGAVAQKWQAEYGLQAAVALGLHLGDTVFGMAGPEGAQHFTAFGDTVSITERLVHRARAGEIVLSGAVTQAMGGTSGARALPPLELGRRAPVVIYGILLDTRLDFT